MIAREFGYTVSALDLVVFAGLFAVLALLLSIWELAGGAFISLLLGFQHFRLAENASNSEGL